MKLNQKIVTEVEVLNEMGMHARPSASFAKIANKHKSEIRVEKDGEVVNGKSILGLMMLGAGRGSHLKIVAEGPDAKDAIDSLSSLVNDGFNEEHIKKIQS